MQSEGQFSTRIYVNNSKSPMAVDEPIYSNFKPQSEVRVDVESSDSELSSEPPRSTQIPILPPPIKPRTSLLKKKAAAAAAVAATQAASAVAAAVSSQNASSGLTFHLEQFSENQNNVRLNNASSEAIIADQFDETYDEPVRQMQPPNFPPPPPPLQSCGQTYEDLDRIPSVSTCRNSAPLHHYHKPQSVSSSNDAPDVDSEAEESDRSDCQTPYELEDLSEQSSRRSSHRLTRIDAQLQKQLQQLDQKLNELTVEESLLGDEPIYGRILPQSPKSNDGATSSEGSPPTAAPIPPPIPPRSVAMLAHRPRLAYPISDGMNGSIASSTTEHHHSSSSSGVDLNRSSSSCSSSSSSKPPNSWTKGSKRSHRPMIGIISPLVRSLSRSSFSLDRKGKSNGTTPKSFDSSKTVTGGDDSTALIESNRKMSTTSGVVAVGRLQDENGYLFKTGPARKQFYRRWCTLDAYALCYYNEPPPADKIATVSPNGRLQLNDVLFVGQSAQTVWMHKSRLARAFRSMRSSATTTTASVASLNSSSFVASANGGGLTSTGINASSLASSLSISCDSDNSIELHAFNVGVCGESGRTYLFAGDSDATRRRWLNAIAVRIRPMLRPASISYDAVDACGYVNLKLGVSGLWTRCWAVLKQRWLCLQLLDVPDGASDAEQLLAIDLRKVMHVSPAPSAPVEPCEAALETGQPFVLVRHAEHSLYVQADFRSHTSHWLTLMQTHWTLPENGLMELQLLSSGDVPLAVEKCLNFICTYGGLATKSLYAPDDEQSSANESSASDAGSVLTIFNHLKGGSSLFEWHLKPEDGFTVFDVVAALKMYLSSFPECILTEQLYPEFIRLAVIGNETNQTNTSNGCAVNHDAKSKSFQSQTESNVATVQPVQSTHVEQLDYQKHNHNLNHVPAADKTEASQLLSLRDLIQRLPPVNRSCLRKLLGHFVCVLDCADLNGSSPVQLAAAIAPILIYSNMSASVCRRLGEQLLLTFICHYAWLFDVRPQELEKERKIQQTLLALRGQKSMNTSSGSAAAGGSSSSNIDMLVGVYVHDRAEGSCVNVPLSSNTTADDLLAYVIRHARLTEPPAQLAVFEVVADEQLQRPLHYSESVLELVLGWASNWPSDDAKGNYLIVRPNQLFEQLQPHLSRSNTRHSSIPLTLFNELRFSDLGAGRSFRRAMLELFETRCNVYKDAKTSKTLASWQLHECFWYIGCETKRAPPTKFCITFVARHQPIERSKETHGFVGRVFACSSQEELHKWIAGLIAAQHPNGVQPIIHSLNLLD